MSEQRQRYNKEFKRQAVKYVQEKTKTLPEIAGELNIPFFEHTVRLSMYPRTDLWFAKQAPDHR
jgi:sortase (surface protein transpeptidase)